MEIVFLFLHSQLSQGLIDDMSISYSVRSMNCFPCCAPKKGQSKRELGSPPPEPEPVTTVESPAEVKKQKPEEPMPPAAAATTTTAQAFTFRELATATKNFRQECLLDEGGYGRIYKGTIPTTGKNVAVMQLDRNGMQGKEEFLADVTELNALQHENLVSLIGYCADGDQRLLVYEYFSGRTLEERLFENKADEGTLSWFDRMKIVAAASKGLEYLHESANPPVIFRDMKASSILVDNDFNAKLRDFGIGKLSGGDKMSNGPPRIMGSYGYCAPEYVKGGQVNLKSDVYSFGVVLLELITGRRAVDTTKPNEEQNLVPWATPLFRDPKRYPEMADPLLNMNFPAKDLNQVVAIASMCLQEEADARPLISDVVTALSFLSTPPAPPPKSSAGEGEGGSVSRKGSRKSSSSRKSGELSQKSSKKSSLKELSQKSSKKSSSKDSSKKSSSRKSSIRDLGKSSKKSSGRVSSHKSSKESDDGSVSSSCRSSSVASEDERSLSGRSSMRLSTGSDHSSSRRSEDESRHLVERACSVGSSGCLRNRSLAPVRKPSLPHFLLPFCSRLILSAFGFTHLHKMDEWKRDAHIPAFGNWDFTNEFPITRYFECATQPRPLRYTSSSAETRLRSNPRALRNYSKQDTRNKGRRCQHVNANRGRVYDVSEQSKKPNGIKKHRQVHDTVPRTTKPVDEDLYKIPPELLHTSNKRKKIMGFISKCLVLLVCHEHC
ncbi:unnamed protein product [Sphenostylis stenocarpa]|uniref:Protein kinase domain-containing protein n=1 Tax=Sphenostylis stenocarpa TaxID=92480 RepID=A0AA86T3I9_9FABA|nr:unnamed protein product [Sphenostylis stenocarpa]